ncbi:phage integrase N-terminal SAM-like domain-containing protein [Spirulina sp. CS-785/01]|uniref:phage integrase N-terminal SAM-like domain-containing protein n=1 Tax=Spirulina sp. CS-785/01 TaxID=3021716 RepID=UPI003FA6A86C
MLYHNKKHPREMGTQEIQDFLTHLTVDRQVVAATQNQALNRPRKSRSVAVTLRSRFILFIFKPLSTMSGFQITQSN